MRRSCDLPRLARILMLCKASIYAQDVEDHMNVAYWITDNRSVFDMKYRDAHEAFKRLAEVMGYKVELVE